MNSIFSKMLLFSVNHSLTDCIFWILVLFVLWFNDGSWYSTLYRLCHLQLKEISLGITFLPPCRPITELLTKSLLLVQVSFYVPVLGKWGSPWSGETSPGTRNAEIHEDGLVVIFEFFLASLTTILASRRRCFWPLSTPFKSVHFDYILYCGHWNSKTMCSHNVQPENVRAQCAKICDSFKGYE